MNIVDFPAQKLKTADTTCIFRDVESGEVKTYLRFAASYEFDGNDWVLEIWATDIAEAQRKLAAISAGRVDGQIYSVIPA